MLSEADVLRNSGVDNRTERRETRERDKDVKSGGTRYIQGMSSQPVQAYATHTHEGV